MLGFIPIKEFVMESITQGFWSFVESSPEGVGFYAGWVCGAILQTMLLLTASRWGGRKREESLTEDQKTLAANLLHPLRDIATEWETSGDYVLKSEEKGSDGKQHRYFYNLYAQTIYVEGDNVNEYLTKRQRKEILALAAAVFKREKRHAEEILRRTILHKSKSKG